MTETAVSHFHGRFAHGILSGQYEFGGSFDAQFPDILADGCPGDCGKGAAYVKGTALEVVCNFLQIYGFFEMLVEILFGFFDAFHSEPLLPGAEEFVLMPRRLETEVRNQFADFPFVPEAASRSCYGRRAK